MDNMTIKRRAAGFGLEWPGDGVAASLLEGGNRSILDILAGGQQGPFWHRADDFDCSLATMFRKAGRPKLDKRLKSPLEGKSKRKRGDANKGKTGGKRSSAD